MENDIENEVVEFTEAFSLNDFEEIEKDIEVTTELIIIPTADFEEISNNLYSINVNLQVGLGVIAGILFIILLSIFFSSY